jgi:hypothetical protein
MKASKVITVILWLFVVCPIWYYLFYKVLEAVKASELMWFLFWVYVPVAIVCGLIAKLSDEK